VTVKIEEVRSKTDDELNYELGQMRKELFELRFKASTAGAANPARIQVLKRGIARVNTILHERATGSTPAAGKTKRKS
jgi:large subunit ribosomal protein L29